MSRQQAREDSFKMIFEAKIMGTPADELMEKFRATLSDGDIWEQKKENKRDIAYMESVLRGVEEKEQELNQKIAPFLKKWTVERLAKVSLSILQLAAYEVLYVEDVPSGVAANEAVNLAKKYGGEDAPAFINGVMRSFVQEYAG
ncbi:MAG: transcription antitermination factor NusB [Clostridia bacterium]